MKVPSTHLRFEPRRVRGAPPTRRGHPRHLRRRLPRPLGRAHLPPVRLAVGRPLQARRRRGRPPRPPPRTVAQRARPLPPHPPRPPRRRDLPSRRRARRRSPVGHGSAGGVSRPTTLLRARRPPPGRWVGPSPGRSTAPDVSVGVALGASGYSNGVRSDRAIASSIGGAGLKYPGVPPTLRDPEIAPWKCLWPAVPR